MVLMGYLYQAIYIAIFVTTLYALIEALRTPAEAYTAMDKQTKGLWAAILGVGTGLSLLAALGAGGFLTFLSLVAALIFILDVRPAVRGIGRGGGSGPYGPW